MSATDRYVRKVGRPGAEWATKVHEKPSALAAQYPAKTLKQLLNEKPEFEWRLQMFIDS